jgi:hypothetical protein
MHEKFTVEPKLQIVIEPFTATIIAELCRRQGSPVAQFRRWRGRFLEVGKKCQVNCDYNNVRKPETILTTNGLERLIYQCIAPYHLFPGRVRLNQFLGNVRMFIPPNDVNNKIYHPNMVKGNTLDILLDGQSFKKEGGVMIGVSKLPNFSRLSLT